MGHSIVRILVGVARPGVLEGRGRAIVGRRPRPFRTPGMLSWKYCH